MVDFKKSENQALNNFKSAQTKHGPGKTQEKEKKPSAKEQQKTKTMRASKTIPLHLKARTRTKPGQNPDWPPRTRTGPRTRTDLVLKADRQTGRQAHKHTSTQAHDSLSQESTCIIQERQEGLFFWSSAAIHRSNHNTHRTCHRQTTGTLRRGPAAATASTRVCRSRR